MAKRFYQIAFELGTSPRSLIGDLSALGLSVGNQMVVVTGDLEDRIRGMFAALHPAESVETAVAVAEPPPPSRSSRGESGGPGAAAEEAESFDAVGTLEELAPEGVETAPLEAEEAVAQAAATEQAGPLIEEPPAIVEAPVAAGPSAPEAPAAPRVEETPTAAAPAAAAPAAPSAKAVPRKYVPPPPSGRLVAPKPRTQGELIPTIDPRAGRLLREAPKTGVPGVTTPVKGRPGQPAGAGGPRDLNPVLAKQAPAPGARRDSRSRESVVFGAKEGDGKHGKQTFQLRSRKRHAQQAAPAADTAPKSVELTPPVSIKAFSEVSGIKVADVIRTLFTKHKQIVTANAILDEDTLTILALEFDRDIKFVKRETSEDIYLKEAAGEGKPEDLKSKPPVVVVMGHVDHGKTSLLDWIRHSDVAAHEAGGITQHIGAYQVALPDGRRITFLDTPGHEAFTEMRRRGAQVTDVAVLVVAADDGVMPQTVEAIDHAKAADVPIVVAITKADKVGFRQDAIDRVKQQLSTHGILAEGWGGEVACFPLSAISGQGVDKLLEHIVLLAEVEELKADPSRLAQGTVIEAENNPGRGVLATLLVQSGTLRRGDAVVAHRAWGRVRALRDDKNALVEDAGPGTPVEVTGLDEVPDVGQKFVVLADANKAREIAETRRAAFRALELAAQAKPSSLEGLFSAIEQGKVKSLKVILKTDVKGSLEAIRSRLDALGNEEVKVQVIRAGVGAVSESDVTLAATYGAIVVGFHVVADEIARMKGKHLGIEIRMYRIIYELEEDLKAILEGKLSPEKRETILGHAEILQIFRSTKLGNIAGCRVRDGLIRRDAQVRLSRDGVVVWEGRIGSLRREKDDAREVKEGFECGIRLEGYDDVKEGDLVEAFTVEQVARTLAT